jgi:hypothetical protein
VPSPSSGPRYTRDQRSPSACFGALLDPEQHPPFHQEVRDLHEHPVCHGSRATGDAAAGDQAGSIPPKGLQRKRRSPRARAHARARTRSPSARPPDAGGRFRLARDAATPEGCGRRCASRTRRGSRATRSCKSHRDPGRAGPARATPPRPARRSCLRAGSGSRPWEAAHRPAARVFHLPVRRRTQLPRPDHKHIQRRRGRAEQRQRRGPAPGHDGAGDGNGARRGPGGESDRPAEHHGEGA